MKPGEFAVCPHCKERTLVVSRSRFNISSGKMVDEMRCASCGHRLEDDKKEEKDAAGLLPEEERRFCRLCRHFVSNAFRCICYLTGQDADPNGDCEKFETMEKRDK